MHHINSTTAVQFLILATLINNLPLYIVVVLMCTNAEYKWHHYINKLYPKSRDINSSVDSCMHFMDIKHQYMDIHL